MIPRRRRSAIVDNTRTVRTLDFGGIDISSSNDTISEFNTPDCLNMLPNNKGDITTRLGIKTVHDYGNNIIKFAFNYMAGAIIINDEGIFFTDDDYTNNLYPLTGIDYASGFEYDNKFYLWVDSKYLVYDETGLFEEVEGYLPTVRINTPAAGGGTPLEEENMLRPDSIQEFQYVTGDTEVFFYKKPLNVLPATFDVWYLNLSTGDWDLKTNGVDYVFNFEDAKLIYTNFPPQSSSADGNDTLRIRATPRNPTVGFGDADTIKNCQLSAIYGGKANVSVWCSGNSDYSNFDFHSGVVNGKSDPTYFPLSEYDEIGFSDQAIVAYQNQNNELIIYKNNSETKLESTWVRSTSIVGNEIIFSNQELDSYRGCVAKGSAVLINNSAWALGKNGYGKVVPKAILAENAIEIQSELINYNRNRNFSSLNGLLEGDIESFVSIDYQGKLYASNPQTNKVWVCDYNNIRLDQTSGKYYPQWYLLDNITATCWVEIDGELYFGTRGGAWAKFKDASDLKPFEDEQEGTTIWHVLPEQYEFYWSSKLNNLGTIQYKEDVESIYLAMQGYSDTILNIWTRTDSNSLYQLKSTHEISSMVYSVLTYSTFVYGGTLFPKAFRSKVKIRNAEYVQVKIGGTTGLPATITSLEMNVSEGKEV